MGPHSPILFAARVSKPLASFSVSFVCSRAMSRARERSAGGIVSGEVAVRVVFSREKEEEGLSHSPVD